MSLKNKQVLVTGGSGVIGKELLKILCSEGAKVRNVDMRALPHEVRDLDVEHFQMDLSDPKSQFLLCCDLLLPKIEHLFDLGKIRVFQ